MSVVLSTANFGNYGFRYSPIRVRRRLYWYLTCCLCLLLGSVAWASQSLAISDAPVAPVSSQDPLPTRAPLMTMDRWNSLWERLSHPWALGGAGAGLVAAVILRSQDEVIREAWMDHQKMSREVASVGDFLGTGIPGFITALVQYRYGAGSFHRAAGISHLWALGTAAVGTYSLKYAVGRRRPGSSQSVHSFPSGHTSTMFATATSLTLAYGWWRVGWWVYSLALLTGLSRLSQDAHWASDVVGGATLGALVGYATWSEGQGQQLLVPGEGMKGRSTRRRYFFIWPLIADSEVGVTAHWNF